jgi:AcrR family transcriptional regulator
MVRIITQMTESPSMGTRPARQNTRKARPKDAAYAEKQLAIREKAREVFARYGYRKTSVEEIGKACGLVGAALYHYYSSKEEIFAEVVRAEGERMIEKFRAACAATDDPRGQLAAYARTFFLTSREMMQGTILSDLAPALRLASEASDRFYDQEVATLSKVLDDGQRRGAFKKLHTQRTAALLISCFRGAALSHLRTRRQTRHDETNELLVSILLEGICK